MAASSIFQSKSTSDDVWADRHGQCTLLDIWAADALEEQFLAFLLTQGHTLQVSPISNRSQNEQGPRAKQYGKDSVGTSCSV